MPKVSVIVPIYNVEKYIEECVRSLMAQTLKDIEFIFVDDGTTDNSMTLLKQMLNNHPVNVKFIKHAQNEGLPLARKDGVMQATSEYIIHCDSDDWVEPEMYECLWKKAQEGNYDLVWCNANTESLDGIENETKEQIISKMLTGSYHGRLWNCLVKRDIYRNNALYFPVGNMAEDLTLILQLIYYSNSYSHIPQHLYHYRSNPNSVSKSKSNLIKQSLYMEKNVLIFEDFFKLHHLDDIFHKEIEFRKFFNKRWILPAITSLQERKTWMNIHKDINFSLFRNPLISIKDKLTSLLVIVGLYHLAKKIRHK